MQLIYQLVKLLPQPGVEPQMLALQLVGSLLFPSLVTALLLPLVFKLGAGMTRILYLGIIFGVISGMNLDRQVSATLAAWGQEISSLPPLLVGLGGIALLALLMAGSIRLSIRFVKQKDY